MKLPEDPGASNVLAGRFPAALEDRDQEHWLVFGPTFVVACQTDSSDVARALVLNMLGYRDRPWLAENLDARPASQGELSILCQRHRRSRPLWVSRKNRPTVHALAAEIHHDDVRRSGDLVNASAVPTARSAKSGRRRS